MPDAPDVSVLSIGEHLPRIDPSVFLAPGARIVGAVTLAEGVSIWYNTVLRADSDAISIGAGSNIQDNVSVHVDQGHPVYIGQNVSIGHNAVVHGCTIGDGSLVGMGSVVLSGAIIGSGCLIAGGAVVLEGTVVPDGSVVAGVPATVRRALTEGEKDSVLRNADLYRSHALSHRTAAPVTATRSIAGSGAGDEPGA